MTKHDALRKQRIIEYIATTVRESGYPPSVREIAAAVGLASTSAVHHHLSSLEKEGLLEDTFVFYFGDHGGVLPRGKGYLYESGLHVPLVVRVPENYKHLVDVDPGIDDAMALCMALFDPQLEVLAVTAVGGNCSPSQASRNVQAIIDHKRAARTHSLPSLPVMSAATKMANGTDQPTNPR